MTLLIKSIFTTLSALALVLSGSSAANSAVLSSTITNTALINPAGGTDAGRTLCPADSVVVGFRWSGGTSNSSPYSIFCRSLNDDGTIPSDAHTTANSAAYAVFVNTSAANIEWCPPGTVATGVRHSGWADFALVCNTPPDLSATVTYSSDVTTPTDRLCAANAVLVGMGKYTGAWLDSLYGSCATFARFTVTYSLNGGTGTQPPTFTQSNGGFEATLPDGTGFSRSGFTFTGWSTSTAGQASPLLPGNKYSPGANVILYAQWGSTITYDANSATAGNVPTSTLRVFNSGNTTLASNSGVLSRNNFTFGGWNTAADGSGTSYAAGLTTYSVNGDRTLFAQWNSTIIYNGNGNTGGTAPAQTTATRTNASTTLATNTGTLTRTGLTFAGWNTAADGSGVTYDAGTTTFQSTGNTTLYANWITTPDTPQLVRSSDTGSSNTDNITNDSTPELSVSNLTIGATVTVRAYSPANTVIGSCSFVATATTQSCSISTPLVSNDYYFRSFQSEGGVETNNNTRSTPLLKVDTVAPIAYVITNPTTNTSISLSNTQNGQVQADSIGTLYLVRNSVTVTDANSITSAASNLWKSISINTANTSNNIALSGLLGGTYRSYVIDLAGNFSAASTNTMLIFSQANAPTDLVATPGVGSIGPKFDLSWTAPTDNGGGISSYLVEFSTNGGTSWSTFPRNASPGTSYSVYPVAYDTDYLFRISAINLWGTGTTSTASEVKKVAIPSCSPAISPNGFTSIFPIGVCSWTVPTGVTSIRVDARGGQGGIGIYGFARGGRVIGTLAVTPGETLLLYVGDQGGDWGDISNPYSGRGGFNGGGFGGTVTASIGSTGSGGGGATDIRTAVNDLTTRLIVAGGAGGSSNRQGNSCCRDIGQGAAGGGLTGGQNIFSDGSSGAGGTQSAGGSGSGGANGALGVGGAGQNQATDNGSGGGGGGGGYYGGGGGGGPWSTGGGGGSSFVSGNRFTSTTNSQGVNCAPGFLALTVGSDVSQVPAPPTNCTTTRDTTPPVISTQTVSTDGLTITLTYTDVSSLSTTFVPRNLFTVTSGGANINVTGIVATGKTLALTLARSIRPGDITTISYSDPSSNDDVFNVQDEFGNDAATFANRTITTTGITVATPTSVTLDAASDTGSSSTDKNTNDNTPTFTASSLVIGATVTFTATPASGSAVTCTITATATTDSCTFASLADGTYSVTVSQRNGTVTSTASTALTGVVINTSRPTVTITNNLLTNNGNYTGTSATTFTLTFNRAVTGLTITGITKTGSNWTLGTLSGSGTSYTITATNTGTSGAEGVLTFAVNSGAATDTFGNTNSASTTWSTNWVATITYNANTGTGTPTKTTDVQSSSTSAITLIGGAGTSQTASGLSKTGNTFNGWATTSTSTTSVGATLTPTANTTLFAIWTPAVYVVTYSANGGTGSSSKGASENYTYGTSAITLPTVGTLTRTGYTFLGWNTSATATTAMASSYTPPSTITLFAVWQANSYTVTFDKNNASATGTTASLGIVAGTPKALTANGFSLVGFTFSSWNTVANGSGTSYSDLQNITAFANTTLYAQWRIRAPGAPTVSATAGNGRATVTVTGAAASSTAGVASSFTVTSNPGGLTCTFSSPDTSCVISGLTNNTSYTFTATATNSTGTSAASAASSSITPQGFTVTYNANSGTVSPTSDIFNAGSPLTLPLPTRTGYNFSGWYSNLALSAFVGNNGYTYSPTGAVTLYAKWTGITYNITYSPNGATGGNVPSRGAYINGDSAYSVVGNTGSLTKTGYSFSTWNTKPDGTGTDVAFTGASYSTAADLTLYPKWIPQVYTVTYSANSGTGSSSKGASENHTYGTAPLNLPTVGTLARSGYTFSGWLENLSDTSTVVSPYSPRSSVTLYANWIGNTYSVSFNSNGGSGSYSSIAYQNGKNGITLPNGSELSRTGYTFAGWTSDAAGSTSVSTPYTTSSDVTLYAKWTPKQINIKYFAGTINGAAPTLSTLPSNTTSTFGNSFTLGNLGASESITVMSGDQYAFIGWSDSTALRAAGSTYLITENDLNLTAQWLPIYTVRYVLNGGAWKSGDTAPADILRTENFAETVSSNIPERQGYDFVGWKDQSGNEITTGTGAWTIKSSSYIAYAQWSLKDVQLFYAANDGGGTVPNLVTKKYGESVTLDAPSALTAPTDTAFDGWLISGVKYGAGSTLFITTDITAIAQWKSNRFSIYFDLNGGNGTAPAPLSGAAGSNINLPSNPARNGYLFQGWNTLTTVLASSATSTTIPASSNATYIATWSLAAPNAPTISNLTASDGSATINVTGDSSGGVADSYLVTALDSSGNPVTPSLTCTIVTPSTACTIAPLTNGSSYKFKVTATNSTGTSADSNISNAITPAGKPSSVTGVSANGGNSQATISFTPPANNGGAAIQSYTVTASPGGASATGSSSPITVIGLTNGTAYTFTVTANNGAGVSNDSSPSAAVTPATRPGVPTIGNPTSSSSATASVPFTAPSSNGGSAITSYTVTATPSGGGAAVTATGTSSPITLSGLTDGVAYTYTVTASNAVGSSDASSSSNSLTTAGNAGPPTNVSATAADGQATVTFSGTPTNGSTINSYTVTAYANGAATTATCTVTTSAANGSCVINGLGNGTAYTFKVTTNSTANGSSTNSADSIASSPVTPAAKPTPATVNAPVSLDNKIRVSWTPGSENGSTITGYTVTAFAPDGTAISPAITCTVPASATSCDLAGFTVGVGYSFKVVTNASPQNSDASVLSSENQMNSVPSAPGAPTVTTGNGVATIALGAAPEANGYAISSYTVNASPGTGSCVITPPATSCNISGLSNGTAYTFTTRATNQLGNSAASTGAQGTPSTVPAAPINVAAAARDSSAEVSFSSGGTGGSSIISYTVTASPGGISATGTNSPITVSGLSNGTAYTFTVTAKNANGDSTISSASTSVTPRANARPEVSSSLLPNGNPGVGQALSSASTFSGNPTPTYTYQWKLCNDATDVLSCTDISGATNSTYSPTNSDVGKFIRVETTANNGFLPDAVDLSPASVAISPAISFPNPTGSTNATTGTRFSLDVPAGGGKSPLTYSISSGTLPNGITIDPATGVLSGTPTNSGTFNFVITVTDGLGITSSKSITLNVASSVAPVVTPTPEPTPEPICNAECQAAQRAAAEALAKAAADKAAADKAAAEKAAADKAAADKAAADKAAADKAAADAAAKAANDKAKADATAAEKAAKEFVEKVAAVAAAKIAADQAAADAAAKAKAAEEARAAADKAAADARAANQNESKSAAEKAAAAKAAQSAATNAAAAVKAAADSAKAAALAKSQAANANKKVDIAINTLISSNTVSKPSSTAVAAAAAAKAAAVAAAKAEESKATTAKLIAENAKQAFDEATNNLVAKQNLATQSAEAAKLATANAAKATSERVIATNEAKIAADALASALSEKAKLTESALTASTEAARSEINLRTDQLNLVISDLQKSFEQASAKAESAIAAEAVAKSRADEARAKAESQAADVVAARNDANLKGANATKAAANASVAARIAAAAKTAAAKVPSKPTISSKTTSNSKNSATATITGLKPGQKVKVTVRVGRG